jgi:hypothetical protein
MNTILLNNNAVYLMQQGQDVVSDFRSALAKLHHVREQHKGVDLGDKVAPNLLLIRSVPLDLSLSSPSSSYQDHHALSLFDRALIIDDAKSAAASSVAGRDCTTAVILFNTGLALHLKGIRDISSRQTSFKKALQLYTMAFGIQEDSDSDSDCIDEVSLLVYLAAMNNMGHIYSYFCEGRAAQHCLQFLYSMLETAKSSGIDVLSDEYLPFSMNALILLGREDAAAAAA